MQRITVHVKNGQGFNSDWEPPPNTLVNCIWSPTVAGHLFQSPCGLITHRGKRERREGEEKEGEEEGRERGKGERGRREREREERGKGNRDCKR